MFLLTMNNPRHYEGDETESQNCLLDSEYSVRIGARGCAKPGTQRITIEHRNRTE